MPHDVLDKDCNGAPFAGGTKRGGGRYQSTCPGQTPPNRCSNIGRLASGIGLAGRCDGGDKGETEGKIGIQSGQMAKVGGRGGIKAWAGRREGK